MHYSELTRILISNELLPQYSHGKGGRFWLDEREYDSSDINALFWLAMLQVTNSRDFQPITIDYLMDNETEEVLHVVIQLNDLDKLVLPLLAKEHAEEVVKNRTNGAFSLDKDNCVCTLDGEFCLDELLGVYSLLRSAEEDFENNKPPYAETESRREFLAVCMCKRKDSLIALDKILEERN